MDFFIVGFPRSRLAWIANYLTYGNMNCHFDVLKNGLDGSGLLALDKYEDLTEIVGIADGGALLYQNQLRAKYPKAKWILVTRPWQEVEASCKKLGVAARDKLVYINQKIEELKTKEGMYILPFDRIDDLIGEVATWINPDWACPTDRHEMLMGLNVQSKLTKVDLEAIPEVNPMSKLSEPVNPTPVQIAYFETLQEICKDNKLAYRWLWQAIGCATIFDHVMDDDLIDKTHFEGVFKGVLLEWGVNDFYRKNSMFLAPTLAACLSAWQHSSNTAKHYDIYTELPCAVAFLLGGQERIDLYMPRLRALADKLKEEDDERDK